MQVNNSLPTCRLFGMFFFYFLDADAAGAYEHFTPVTVSSQWQAFQRVWALVQMAGGLGGLVGAVVGYGEIFTVDEEIVLLFFRRRGQRRPCVESENEAE
jgi:hypothetical protein